MMTRSNQGIAWIWVLGGALLSLLLMIFMLIGLILFEGFGAFWPKPVYESQEKLFLYWGSRHKEKGLTHLLYNPNASIQDEFLFFSPERLEQLKLVSGVWFLQTRGQGVFLGFLDEDWHEKEDVFQVKLPQGREVDLKKSQLILAYQPNDLNIFEKSKVFLLQMKEFLFEPPREANLEGGIFPALVGTVLLTFLMMVFLIPIGLLTAIYMHEIAKQSVMVSLVRVSVGNLAGVPSIVYGVFGLGFFAYVLGGGIDRLFFTERLPSPTFGSGGLLWAALTLALLTMPILIVSTEEALAFVEPSLREASLGCGATRLQTILKIVLPKAAPGMITGIILSLTRGVGEVAPLILTGVVKFMPQLPFDSKFPYLHLERNFTHLAYHIYDLGFHSRSHAFSRPRVFASIFILICLIFFLNAFALSIRNRLRKRYEGLGAF